MNKMSHRTSLQDSVLSIRKTIEKSRFAYRKAETLVLIKKYPFTIKKLDAVRSKPCFPLKRHVYFDEYIGSSIFLVKSLKKYKIDDRRYYEKDFYKFQPTKQKNFFTGNDIKDATENMYEKRKANYLLKHFTRKAFLIPKTNEIHFQLNLAVKRLEIVKKEVLQIKDNNKNQIKKEDTNVNKILPRVNSQLFHNYPQQIEKEFGYEKVQNEKSIMEHNVKELEREYTYLKYGHDLIIHSANVIARAYRQYQFYVAARKFRKEFKKYLIRLNQSSKKCYEKLLILWQQRAAALRIQNWWRGRSARIKYLARLNWLMFLAVVLLLIIANRFETL